MYFETLITMVKLFAAYFLIVVMLTAFMLKPLINKKTLGDKFLICTVVGNFYIITIVYIIAFLGEVRRLPLALALLGVAVSFRIILDRKKLMDVYNAYHHKFITLISGEYGGRLFLRDMGRALKRYVSRSFSNFFGRRVLEWLLFLGAMAVIIYFYSYQSLHYYSYAAPDEEVHLYWIQSLIAGKFFPAGVYPHGFHNVLAALIVLFQFKSVAVIQIFSVVSAVLIMTMLYLLLKRTCRSPYIAGVVFFIFAISGFYSRYATARYQFSVPQEYAMIFLYPLAIFLINYFRKGKKEDLCLFGLALSLTFAVHFYVTIIAVALCAAIGIVYMDKLLKELKRIVLYTLLTMLTAILPLAFALLLGNELEQSIGWAVGIIETGNQSAEESQISEEQQAEEQLKEEERETFQEKFVHEITKYVVVDMKIFYTLLLLILLTMVHSIIRIILKKTYPQTRLQLSLGVYGCLLLFLVLCRPLGLPTLMEAKRAGIFFAYLSPVFIGAPFEVIYELSPLKYTRIISAGILVSLFGIVSFMKQSGLLKEYDYFYYIQTKGAMIASNRILNEYEDFEWTVISPVNEGSIVMINGYHYELVDFLENQENWNFNTELRIPTKYLFLFVEKRPIINYGFEVEVGSEDLTERQPVSEDSAARELVAYEDSEKNYSYIDQRDVVMSKAYYWAKQYTTYFPEEMSVYYEDEEILVYKIVQNEYALNNLAINYGFNSK